MTASGVWPRLLGPYATFSVRSWRTDTLSSVRHELEAALGLRFVDYVGKDYDGREAYECELPACELRLNAWWSGARGVRVLNLIGIPHEGERGGEIAEAVAAHLQGLGLNWYVPSLNECLDEGGVLGAKLFDPDMLVQVLEARWLWACSADERVEGRALLHAVAEGWLKVVRSLMNPLPELKRLRNDLEGRGARVAPSERLEVLRTHVRTKR